MLKKLLSSGSMHTHTHTHTHFGVYSLCYFCTIACTLFHQQNYVEGKRTLLPSYLHSATFYLGNLGKVTSLSLSFPILKMYIIELL